MLHGKKKKKGEGGTKIGRGRKGEMKREVGGVEEMERDEREEEGGEVIGGGGGDGEEMMEDEEG